MSRISIRLEGITKNFGDKIVISGVDYNFDTGNLYLIKGKSGCGKSTLLSIIGLLEKPTSGKIKFSDSDQIDNNKHARKYANTNISYLFQDNNLIEEFTVKENLSLVKSAPEKMVELLSQVKMEQHLDKQVSQLSKGEKMRVSLVRVLLEDKPIWLLDEPTANLDADNIKIILDILNRAAANKLVIAVVHNSLEDLSIPHVLLTMETGRITGKIAAYRDFTENNATLAPLKKLKLSKFIAFQKWLLNHNIFAGLVFFLLITAISFSSLFLFDLFAIDCNRLISGFVEQDREDILLVESAEPETDLARQYSLNFTFDDAEIVMPCLYYADKSFIYREQYYDLDPDQIVISKGMADRENLSIGDQLIDLKTQNKLNIRSIIADDPSEIALVSPNLISDIAKKTAFKLPLDFVQTLSRVDKTFSLLTSGTVIENEHLKSREVNIVLPTSIDDSFLEKISSKIEGKKIQLDGKYKSFLGKVLPTFSVKGSRISGDFLSLEVSPSVYSKLINNFFELGYFSDFTSSTYCLTRDYFKRFDYTSALSIDFGETVDPLVYEYMKLADWQQSIFWIAMAIVGFEAMSILFIAASVIRSFRKNRFILYVLGYERRSWTAVCSIFIGSICLLAGLVGISIEQIAGSSLINLFSGVSSIDPAILVLGGSRYLPVLVAVLLAFIVAMIFSNLGSNRQILQSMKEAD